MADSEITSYFAGQIKLNSVIRNPASKRSEWIGLFSGWWLILKRSTCPVIKTFSQ